MYPSHVELQFHPSFSHMRYSAYRDNGGDKHVEDNHGGAEIAALDVGLVGVVALGQRVAEETVNLMDGRMDPR